MKKIKYLFGRHWPLFLASFALFFLLFRNPYSTRTLIPNFEPFPDSFHYVTVARCFIAEGTWNLCRSGLQTGLPGSDPSVPQGYSLALLPGFLLSFDPRTFYFTNVFLSYLSVVLLYAILKKITKEPFIHALVLGITVTSYHFFWLPTLAMAENLLVPLFLLSCYLMLQKTTKKVLLATGTVSVAFYFTKFAYVPLVVTLVAVQFFKMALPNLRQKKYKQTLIATIILGLPILLLLPFSYNFAKSIAFLLRIITPKTQAPGSSTVTNSYFGMSVFADHFSEYVQILLGHPARFLWDVRPWFSKLIGWLGFLGILSALIKPKHRTFALYLGISTLAQTIFMSTFYAFDSRYIFTGFFAILLGLALLLDNISSQKRIQMLLKKLSIPKKLFVPGTTLILGIILLGSRLLPLKSQVMLNLKYAESPWWYLSIQEYNAFFSSRREEQAQLISLTSPYMVDFFTNNTYVVLPFDEQQDFNQKKLEVWGVPNNQSLLETYTQKLTNGEKIYLANYGIEASGQFKNTFKKYSETFELEKVHEGCFNLCNIYTVSLSKE